MFIIIIIVFVGVLFGFLFREKKSFLKVVNILVNVAIYILLLLLGIGVGSNEAIMKNLGAIGLKAFSLTVAAIAGSIVVGVIAQRLAFRTKENEK